MLKQPAFAAFAALLGTISLCCVGLKHPSKGFVVSIAKSEPCGPDDRRVIVLQVIDAGRLRLNHDDISFEDLPGRLDETFRTRAVHDLLFLANTDLQYGQVVSAIDAARPHVDYISIVTAQVANSAAWWTGTCIDPNLPKPPIDRSRIPGK